MARSRMIKPSLFTNELLAELPMSARLLFIGLWTIADRDGRLEDRPAKIKAEVLPFDRVRMDELLGFLHDSGFIVRYEIEGDRYIQIVKFSKHQAPHQREPAGVIPAPKIGPNVIGTDRGLERTDRGLERTDPGLKSNDAGSLRTDAEKIGTSAGLPLFESESTGLAPVEPVPSTGLAPVEPAPRARDPESLTESESDPPRDRGAAAPAPPLERFYKAQNNGQRVGALVDAAKAVGRALDGGRIAGMLRDHTPTEVAGAFGAAVTRNAASLEDYMQGVLRNARQRTNENRRAPRSGTKSNWDDAAYERAEAYARGETDSLS